MSLLLNIDTATEHASVCLSNNSIVLGMIESTEQKNHASFIQPAIQGLMAQTGHSLKDLDAVAVTAGPAVIQASGLGWLLLKGSVLRLTNL